MVSGLPNITPIFSRIWLMKIMQQFGLGTGDDAVSLRRAWDIRRAWRPDVGVAHLALDLRARHQGRHRVDHQVHVDGAAAHQHLGDLQGLLAVVRLRHQQVRRC